MTALNIWVQHHSKALILFVGAVAMALKPYFLEGARWNLTQWLAVGIVAAQAFTTYITPNLEGKIGAYAKSINALIVALIGALVLTAPGGFSRADVWTIAAAVGGAGLVLLTPTIAPKAVQDSGPGVMGDSAKEMAL